MHVFYLREAWRSFMHHRGLGYTAILSLTAALTLSGILLLFAHNAEVAMRLVGDRREMVVYLKDQVTVSQRNVLIQRLSQLYGDVTYVGKDQAWREFAEQIGDPSLLEAVEGNPLPASLRIHLKPELMNYEAMDQAAKQVAGIDVVEDVRYGGEWVRRLDEIGTGITRGAWSVAVLVALAIVFVLYNTIRLTVLARRPIVEIMSRLGAGDRFIATPFVIEAMIVAAFSALFALGVVFAFQRAFVSQVVNIAFLPLPWIAAFVGATIALAWVAAMLALSRVLRAVGA